jgi:hypothetical protein
MLLNNEKGMQWLQKQQLHSFFIKIFSYHLETHKKKP